MCFVLFAAFFFLANPTARAASPEPIDAARIDAVAALLPATPGCVGPTIDDRQAWQAVARSPEFAQVVPDAEKLLKETIPELTDELYLDYSRTGNRSRCQRVLSTRHGRVSTLVLAECIENRGRFLPAIEEAIRAVCSEKTWVLPAHDGGLANFRGQTNEIDLAVAAVSWNLATAGAWLGEKLDGDVRALIQSELERRTFKPFEGMVTEGKPRMWWLTGTNNWNAVCLAGVTGSALVAIESPRRRAFFVAAAERYIQYFLSGFTPDGYCSEGIGYWNYGFGNYVALAETVYQATGGRIDLLADPKVHEIARFGVRMEIIPGVYPAFADCHVGSRPSTDLMAFLSRRFGWGLAEIEHEGLLLAGGPSSNLFDLGLFGFANSATARPPAEQAAPAAFRDWFSDAGILVCRPQADGGLGAAIKGGHNAEHHNHNDVGSFLLAVGGKTPLVDPGSEVYTARTFSSRRYDSDVLNSFGHPVPMLAGQLQRSGRAAAAKVLETEFTDVSDAIALDITAAYAVEPLESLRRTFVFSRAGQGSLSVSDEVRFSSPQTFGTALVTFSPWRKTAPDRLVIGDGAGAVEVRINTDGAAFEVHETKIEEDLSGHDLPTRLGIDLAEPVSIATITLTISPAADGL
jgi:hypothetical protein